MIDPAPCPAAEAAPDESTPAARRAAALKLAEARVAMLTRLAELAMEFAEDAAARRRTPEAPEPDAAPADGEPGRPGRSDPLLAFNRAARAVRLTLALHARLSKDLAALDEADARARSIEAVTLRARVQRLVERAIEAEHEDPDLVEHLSDTVKQTLREAEDWGGLFRRPVGEIVDRLCRGLGLCPDWRARNGLVWPGGEGEDGGNGQTGGDGGEAGDGEDGRDGRDEKDDAPIWRSAPTPAGPSSPHRAAPATPRSG